MHWLDSDLIFKSNLSKTSFILNLTGRTGLCATVSQRGCGVRRGTLAVGGNLVAFNSLEKPGYNPFPPITLSAGKAWPVNPVSSDSKLDLDPALSLPIKGTIITTFSECFEICKAYLGPPNQTQLCFLPLWPNFLTGNQLLNVMKCLSLSLTPLLAPHFLASTKGRAPFYLLSQVFEAQTLKQFKGRKRVFLGLHWCTERNACCTGQNEPRTHGQIERSRLWPHDPSLFCPSCVSKVKYYFAPKIPRNFLEYLRTSC